MTAPIHPTTNEVMASMDDTHDDLQPESSGGPGPDAAPATTAQAVSESAEPAPRPALTHSPASADPPQPAARRIDAGNTALLIGIIVGLIGSVSVLFGIPVFLLNEEVNRVGDDVDSLRDDMNALRDDMNAGFAAQDTRIENRFAAQDAKIAELQRGVSEIDRKLTALIASLDKTDTVEAALAGDIPP